MSFQEIVAVQETNGFKKPTCLQRAVLLGEDESSPL